MPDQQILRIGVTGHRFLRDTPVLLQTLQVVLKKIIERHSGEILRFFSPLAPGSDQLAGQAALACSIPLVVLLPFNEERYLQTFPEESRKDYLQLARQAEAVIRLPAEVGGEPAYEELGEYLAAHMDVLVAIWNGQPAHGPGGTGEVVDKFRTGGKPLVWIRADNMLPGKPVYLPPELEPGSMVYENW